MDCVFMINGKSVNYERARALWKPLDQWPIGDLKALEILGVRTTGRKPDEALSITEGAAIAFHLARKCTPAISMADFDALTLAQLAPVMKFLEEHLSPPPDSADPASDQPGGPGTDSPLPGTS